MVKQLHTHTGGQGFANQLELDALAKPAAKNAKKSMVGLNFEDANLTGQRIFFLLNLGLSDLPEPILKRIMASRNRALQLHKDCYK